MKKSVLVLLVIILGIASAPAQDAKTPPLKVLVACSKNQLRDYEKYLEQHYHVQCTWAGNEGKKDEKPGLTGLESLESCDVMLLNLYRWQLFSQPFHDPAGRVPC